MTFWDLLGIVSSSFQVGLKIRAMYFYVESYGWLWSINFKKNVKRAKLLFRTTRYLFTRSAQASRRFCGTQVQKFAAVASRDKWSS